MDPRTLKVFIQVSDTLNFSRVAEISHMSVSAVSRTINRLEQQVGVALLQRSRRAMYLTPAGREFSVFARDSLVRWEELKRSLNAADHLRGELSLFCSVTASLHVLGPIIDAFQSRYREVDLMLHTGDQADGIARVMSRIDDIAVSAKPNDLPQALEFLPLMKSRLVLCIPKREGPVRSQIAGDGVDWSSLPFILPERGVSREAIDRWFSELAIQPSVYAQVSGHEAIVAMVSLGLGVGIVPELVQLGTGLAEGVEVISAPIRLPELMIGLCTLSPRLKDPLLRSFWNVASETYHSP